MTNYLLFKAAREEIVYCCSIAKNDTVAKTKLQKSIPMVRLKLFIMEKPSLREIPPTTSL